MMGISVSNRVALFLVLVFLAASCVITVKPVRASGDSWAAKAPMPTARGGLGVAVVDGKIYAIGGSTEGGYQGVVTGGVVGTNEEYDPTTDMWTSRKPMPTPRYYFAIAVCQNKIYCIGGSGGLDSSAKEYLLFGANEVYDPATDTWEQQAPMSTPRDFCRQMLLMAKST